MDIAKLKTELTEDPLERGLAAMTDEEAAARGHVVDRVVTYERFATYRTLMSEVGPSVAAAIYDAVSTAAASSTALAMAHSMLVFYGKGGGVDFGHARTRGFLDTLQSTEVLTAAQVTACKALGEKTISRWTELGLGNVRTGHIEQAKAQ